MKKAWCIPATANAAFVCQREEVLDLYTQPYDAQRPLICMDEASTQLLADVTDPFAMQTGQPRRYDYEYERHGVANLFIFFEPLSGTRHLKVTQQRTKLEWAHAMRELAEVHYPTAETIVVVLDNLNTHSAASFYAAFAPDEARRLARRFEFHYTPKHGSWLNMAEIELSVLARQCLAQRIPDPATLRQAVAAWQNQRNARASTVDWRFTTADARIKLRRLYPKIHD